MVEMWGDLRGDGDGSDAVWALYVCIWSIEFRTIRGTAYGYAKHPWIYAFNAFDDWRLCLQYHSGLNLLKGRSMYVFKYPDRHKVFSFNSHERLSMPLILRYAYRLHLRQQPAFILRVKHRTPAAATLVAEIPEI
jgi:hypothetical protein